MRVVLHVPSHVVAPHQQSHDMRVILSAQQVLIGTPYAQGKRNSRFVGAAPCAVLFRREDQQEYGSDCRKHTIEPVSHVPWFTVRHFHNIGL